MTAMTSKPVINIEHVIKHLFNVCIEKKEQKDRQTYLRFTKLRLLII